MLHRNRLLLTTWWSALARGLSAPGQQVGNTAMATAVLNRGAMHGRPLKLSVLARRTMPRGGSGTEPSISRHLPQLSNSVEHCRTYCATSRQVDANRGVAFLQKLWPVLLRSGVTNGNKDGCGKVVDFLQPSELESSLDLQLRSGACSNEQLLELCERIIKYSVKTGHPRFFNQLYQGLDEFALAGSYLTETLHSTSFTYEIAPVVTLMEMLLIEAVGRDLVRYQQVDGTFCPGGSVSNMYALSLARFKRFPETKKLGMQGIPKVHMYTSELSHFSVKKGAFFMGFGLDNLIMIKTDRRGRMIPEELDQAIKDSVANGITPLLVVATQGTTVFGAYDPLQPIADVCDKHGVWLHADGAWGGSVIITPNHRHKVDGIERTDSFTWDAHKMMGSLQQCSFFVTKHAGLLSECHNSRASYLFQQDKCYDVSYDVGDKSFQCGRRMDALRLWLQWKAHGTDGMARRIDKCFENSRYLLNRLRSSDGFRLLVDEPECTNICFWYIPPSMRDKEENEDWWSRLAKVAPQIKARMQEQGTMMIGYQPQGSFVNFFRFVLSNPETTAADMDFVISEIERLGQDL